MPDCRDRRSLISSYVARRLVPVGHNRLTAECLGLAPGHAVSPHQSCMLHDPQDTIAAVASPPGASARGIIRLSGPRTIDCVEPAWQPAPGSSPTISLLRRAAMAPGTLRVDGFNAPLPCDVYVWPTAQLHAPTLCRNSHRRIAANLAGRAPHRLPAGSTSGGTRRVHVAGVPGRTIGPDAGRGGARRDRRPRSRRARCGTGAARRRPWGAAQPVAR